MSRRTLPHTSPNLTSSTSHFPSSKRIANDNRWPGVPNLHPLPYNPGAGNINTEGETGSNGIISTTFISHQADEEYIQQHQMVWMDLRDRNNIKLINFVQLNLAFAEIQANPQKYLKPTETFNIGFIHDNFRFAGIVAANDQGTRDHIGRRPSRAHTLNIFGYTQSYDYWSHKSYIVKPWSTLYFVIKKIKVDANNHFYQTKINTNEYDFGKQVENIEGKYIYQVVPFATHRRYIVRKEYTYLNERGMEELGSYWYVGRVYENNNIENIGILKQRNKYATGRDISRLYNDTATLMHLYLLRDRDVKIWC